MDGWMDGWMDGCMDVWMYGCMDVCTKHVRPNLAVHENTFISSFVHLSGFHKGYSTEYCMHAYVHACIYTEI